MTPDFDIGTEATYDCDPGFILVGVMFRNCTVGMDGTGVWTEDPPTCERKDLFKYSFTIACVCRFTSYKFSNSHSAWDQINEYFPSRAQPNVLNYYQL